MNRKLNWNTRQMKWVVVRLVVVYVISMSINYLWEMAQMPLYQDMRFDDLRAYLLCLRASFGDANITITIFTIGLLLFRSWYWPNKLTIPKLAYLVISGGGTAILIELVALNRGSWTYTPLMPVFPVFRTGLVPFLQLIILPYVSYLLSLQTPIYSKPRKSD